MLSGCISDVCHRNTPVYWLHSTCLCCLYVNQMFVIGTFQSIGYTPRFCVVRLYFRCLSYEHSCLLVTLHVFVLSGCISDVCHRNTPVYWLHSTCLCCQDVNQMFVIGTFQSIGYTPRFCVVRLYIRCLSYDVYQLFVIGTLQSIGYTPRVCVVRMYIRCLS